MPRMPFSAPQPLSKECVGLLLAAAHAPSMRHSGSYALRPETVETTELTPLASSGDKVTPAGASQESHPTMEQ